MPIKKIEVTFDLWDYFSKFGFGDGDDGAAVDRGYMNRDLAMQIIEKHLSKVSENIEVRQSDTASWHNNCRIELIAEPGHHYIDVEDGEVRIPAAYTDHSEKFESGLKAALKKAYDEFDRRAE